MSRPADAPLDLPLAERLRLARRFPEIARLCRARWQAGAERAAGEVEAVYAEYAVERAFELREAFDLALEVLGPGELDGLRLTRAFAPAPRVVGYPGRVARLLANAMQNAVEATARCGAMTLLVAREGERAVARVRDGGPGMTAAVRARLFEVGFTTKGGCQGCRGHGLAFALEIAREHGATLEVESEPGEGTTVTLGFPRARWAP